MRDDDLDYEHMYHDVCTLQDGWAAALIWAPVVVMYVQKAGHCDTLQLYGKGGPFF